MTRLKDVADVVAGQSPPSNEVDLLADGQAFLQGNAEFGSAHPSARYECVTAPRVCEVGDVLLSVRAPVGAVNIADQKYGIGRGLCAIRPRLIDSVYLAWWLRQAAAELESLANGSTFTAVTASTVGSLVLPVTDRRSQRGIGNYLDRETARIDTLIEEQQRLTETLRERRVAAVEAAVASVETDGARLKHLVRSVRQGWSPQCYAWPADGVTTWAVLKAGAANAGVFRPGENKELPEDATPRPDVVVREGDLLVSRANTRDLVGSAAVVEGDYPRLMLCDKLYAFELDTERALPRFVAAVLGSRRWRSLIEIEATGASHSMLNVSQADIVNLPMPLPALDEQRRIVAHLGDQTAKIDQLIAETERFIELSKERRAALITAAVTGQIDVRNEVA